MLGTHTGHVRYSYQTCPVCASSAGSAAASTQYSLIIGYIYDCLSILILQTLTTDGIGDCEILDKKLYKYRQ